jgi:cell division protein FtsI/penicillin-binding protein 2
MISVRSRAMLAVVLFAAGFTVISARLVFVQLFEHERYRDMAIQKQYDRFPIAPRRGNIYDSQNRILAQTINLTDLRVDGKLAWDKPGNIDALAAILGRDAAELRTLIRPDKRYFLLQQELDQATIDKIKASKLSCVMMETRMKRFYPNGSEAIHVLGFTNPVEEDTSVNDKKLSIEKGVDGVERSMDSVLRGVSGERWVVRAADRKEIPAYRLSDRQAKDGYSVILTLDQGIQHTVEMEADRLVQEYQPEALHIIVLRPRTGEIVALTNRPTFDPNNRANVNPQAFRNGAIMDVYEPGSTFKIITLSAVLNEHIADLDSSIFCENGQFYYAGHWLKDVHANGTLSVLDAFAKSSNIAFAKLALLLGEDKLFRYVRLMGFGQPAQSSLPRLAGEQAGLLRPVQMWSQVDLTRVPIGYGVAVTNLQMTMAAGAVANEGKLMEPRIIKAVVDSQGRVVKQFLPRVVRQVMDRETAAKVTQAMEAVTAKGGTAYGKADVPGYTDAGKTGTARKLVNGEYSTEHYRASFIGFLPAENPEFLVSILVDEPKGSIYYGGVVAAPAFAHIASRVAELLDMTPSEDVPRAVAQGGPRT